mgnify:CR=1 FL=1
MIMEALAKYVFERNRDIGLYETQRIRENSSTTDKSDRVISYEEYKEIKRLADNGDEEAKKRLEPP